MKEVSVLGESDNESSVLIVYDSKTGNVEWFARQLGLPMRSVNDLIECKDELKQSIFLITHTIKRGMVTKATQEFLNRYAGNTIGVCVSGDQRWGQLFGLAGDKIHLEYDIPLVRKIDLRGYPSDIEAVASWIQNWTEKLEKNV